MRKEMEEVIVIKVGDRLGTLDNDTVVFGHDYEPATTTLIIANRGNDSSRWKRLNNRLRGFQGSRVDSTG